jgi:hypothetical protein
LNLTFAFAAFGIQYGAVDQSFAPPYFMKVNGMPYWRMLFANNASEPPANPLHMYIYDSDYNIKDTTLYCHSAAASLNREHHTGQVATADAADRTRVEGHQDQF